MSLKRRILKAWYGFAPGSLEYAGIKGYLPINLQKSEPYTLGLYPHIYLGLSKVCPTVFHLYGGN